MSYYHIIIAKENRNPTVTQEYQEYVGEFIEIEELDEDGEPYVCEHMMTYDNPASWETRTRDVPNPRLATSITSTVQQGEEWVAGEQMLHAMNSRIVEIDGVLHAPAKQDDGSKVLKPIDITADQFVMVAEWDGTAPYVTMHKGDYAARNMEYSGWPSITKEQYDAIPAPDPVV